MTDMADSSDDQAGVNLMRAAEDAAGALLQVYELAFDRLDGSDRDSIGKAWCICNDILDGDL